MPSYLVEVYQSNSQAVGVSDSTARVKRAATELTGVGTSVRFLGSIAVPDDELLFHLFEAPSHEVVARATSLARIEFERIVEIRRFGFEDG